MVVTIDDVKNRNDFVKTTMVKGMEFAVLESEHDRVYKLIDYNGKVYDTILTDVYSSEGREVYSSEKGEKIDSDNLTLAMTVDGSEVMVDDDGIHYNY